MLEFRKKETPTIMDGLVIRYGVEKTTFEISSSRNSIAISGYLNFTTKESLESIKNTLDQCFKEYIETKN